MEDKCTASLGELKGVVLVPNSVEGPDLLDAVLSAIDRPSVSKMHSEIEKHAPKQERIELQVMKDAIPFMISDKQKQQIAQLMQRGLTMRKAKRAIGFTKRNPIINRLKK